MPRSQASIVLDSNPSAGDGLYVYNSTTAFRSQPVRALPSPIEVGGGGDDKSDRGSHTVTVAASRFVGNGATYSWGLGAFGTGSQTAALSISGSVVRGWDLGVVGYYDGGNGYTSPVSLSLTGNTIAGNTSYGVAQMDTAHPAAAENNWWGDDNRTPRYLGRHPDRGPLQPWRSRQRRYATTWTSTHSCPATS